MMSAVERSLMTWLPNLRIAVTGTPGCGKSSLCQAALREAGAELRVATILNIEELAQEHACLGSVDPSDGAAPIDVERLAEKLSAVWSESPSAPTFIDGHLAHLLPVDAIIALRCDPRVLERRLSERSWGESKIRQNCEWELIGGVWSDILEGVEEDKPVLEIDATSESPVDNFLRLVAWVRDGFMPVRPFTLLDWIAVIHGA